MSLVTGGQGFCTMNMKSHDSATNTLRGPRKYFLRDPKTSGDMSLALCFLPEAETYL